MVLIIFLHVRWFTSFGSVIVIFVNLLNWNDDVVNDNQILLR